MKGFYLIFGACILFAMILSLVAIINKPVALPEGMAITVTTPIEAIKDLEQPWEETVYTYRYDTTFTIDEDSDSIFIVEESIVDSSIIFKGSYQLETKYFSTTVNISGTSYDLFSVKAGRLKRLLGKELVATLVLSDDEWVMRNYSLPNK